MLANPRTFRCPNCKEMINDSMTQCRYCSVPVDPIAGSGFVGGSDHLFCSDRVVGSLAGKGLLRSCSVRCVVPYPQRLTSDYATR